MIATDNEPFLSRRGHDPIRISVNYPDALLVAAAIRPCTLRGGNLMMPYTPLTDDRTTPLGTTGVFAVAGFMPVLEPVHGDHWFCDLPIVPGPFLLAFA
jgi:hypothetical protein